MNSKWTWLGSESGEIVEFQVPNGGAAIALIARASALHPVHSRIGLLGREALRSAQATGADNWFETGLVASGLKNEQIQEVRILGQTSSIDTLSNLCKKSKLIVGKPVVLTEPFPQMQFLPGEGRIRVQKQIRTGPLKVLIVDDSETIRTLLTHVISQDPALECVGAVSRPSEVESAIIKLRPDVLTLDIHMPEMNGVELLKILMTKFPIPVVMISSLSKDEGSYVLDALEAGAVDYIQKPSMQEISTAAPLICEKIKQAGAARVQLAKGSSKGLLQLPRAIASSYLDLKSLVVIGSSTGGTEALKVVLTSLPENIPPILIVQHIPAVFSKAFAERMNQLCPFEVKEGQHGDLVQANRVIIAPGGFQMRLLDRHGQLSISIEDSEPVNRHKPSVDFLFQSVADLKIRRVAAAILTGMGGDGARGMLALRKIGAHTLAQNEETCVVYGMPQEAVKLGAAERVVPLDQVGQVLMQYCERKTAKANEAS